MPHRCLRSDHAGKVLINLCIAILLLLIWYLVATRGRSLSTGGCVIAMALCHYFLMATFLWLVIDVINVYQMIITVFITYDSKFLLKRALVAWGLY